MQTTAPAKINLHLGVSRERDAQGYHLVETVMCPLELADIVQVELVDDDGDVPTTRIPAASVSRTSDASAERYAFASDSSPAFSARMHLLAGDPSTAPAPALVCPASSEDVRIELTCTPNPVGAPQDNLAWKAAEALARRLGRAGRVRIAIGKHIPSQAGLGGGSSDAAAVLRCLATLWGVSPTAPEVVEVARSLGADVPFFLYEATCYLGGRGDVFVERLPLPRMSVVLVKPPVGVSTPAAYRTFDEHAYAVPACDELRVALRGQAVPRTIAALVANNLQDAACIVEPQVAGTLAWLASLSGALGAPLLCGSGACCALFVADDATAHEVALQARARGLWAHPTHTLPSAS